jgi:hypothetical protein
LAVPSKDPELRRLQAQKAIHARWARASEQERKDNAARARQGQMERFEREVDPEGKLSPAERAFRADHAWKAHLLGMSLKAAQKRRAEKGDAE